MAWGLNLGAGYRRRYSPPLFLATLGRSRPAGEARSCSGASLATRSPPETPPATPPQPTQSTPNMPGGGGAYANRVASERHRATQSWEAASARTLENLEAGPRARLGPRDPRRLRVIRRPGERPQVTRVGPGGGTIPSPSTLHSLVSCSLGFISLTPDSTIGASLWGSRPWPGDPHSSPGPAGPREGGKEASLTPKQQLLWSPARTHTHTWGCGGADDRGTPLPCGWSAEPHDYLPLHRHPLAAPPSPRSSSLRFAPLCPCPERQTPPPQSAHSHFTQPLRPSPSPPLKLAELTAYLGATQFCSS